MQKNYYITTPMYYVNDKPHIGHAYTSIAVDILARFKKLDGYNVIFATGTDEHGQKVETSAKKNNKSPENFVDEVSKFFRELSILLNLSNTDFIRTTENRHKIAVQHLWKTLQDAGYIYLGKYSGWYALRDEAFYNEDELTTINDKKYAPSGAEVEWKEEESYFFKLSTFEDKLLHFYENNPHFIAPKARYNEIKSFVKSGLKDLSISRNSFSWGIPVPNNEKHVIYVWLDALTSYISTLGYPKSDNFSDFWSNAVHIMGKDITRFHAIYWPAFLMAAKIAPPKRIFSHGWWLNNGQKISKSLGNMIYPNDLINKYGLDQVRYFLFREITFGSDGSFSHESIIDKINNDLANEYGNLVQRVSSIIHKSFNGSILYTNLSAEQESYLNNIHTNILKDLRILIDEQELSKYLDKIWEMIKYANAYINDTAPWRLLKNNQDEEAGKILTFICEIIKNISILLNPFMPDTTTAILSQLNWQGELNFNILSKRITTNHKINAPVIAFKKYLDETIDEKL